MNIITKTNSTMNRTIFIILIASTLLCGCRHYGQVDYTTYGPLRQIDSLCDNGANPYDIASYLYEHPESLDLDIGSTQSDGYTVMTSSDGEFRVYSIYDWPGLSFPQIKNIFHYRNGRYDDDIHLKVEVEDWGCISSIGTVKNEEKSYYILVSDYYSELRGTCCVTMVSVYSLDDQIYDSLKREMAFITRSGRKIESIEVRWEDYKGFSFPDNYWGISMDNPHNTREIYVQVVDANTGKPLDRAIVYKWNKDHFEYSDIRPMKIERIIE